MKRPRTARRAARRSKRPQAGVPHAVRGRGRCGDPTQSEEFLEEVIEYARRPTHPDASPVGTGNAGAMTDVYEGLPAIDVPN
ncbi:hypothetical protein C9J85_06525 [Haloferax sp. wsp5]|nr:hypothetical protein C9J85_06525 [Haloferax sp. wsp5]